MTKLSDWFEAIASGIEAGHELAALREFQLGLDQRRTADPDWRSLNETLAAHRLHRLLLEDPYTQRAFTRPRGIPGDAVMLDFVYGHRASAPHVAAASDVGRRICAGTAGLAPPAQAVRLRRSIAANFVERTAYLRGQIDVMTLAAGHLREYEWVHDVARRPMRWTAVEGDPAAAAVIAQDYPGITCVGFDLMAWVRRPPAGPTCDCIYTLGLLDYLLDPVALRLLSAMWAALRPGGRLLAGNFLPGAPGRGYLEAAMGWKLRYRTVQDLAQLGSGLAGGKVAIFADSVDCCAYLEAEKDGG